MKNYYYNLVINTFLMTFAIISVLELIYDKSLEGSFFRKIKTRGWGLIIFAFLSIGFNFLKDCRSEHQQESLERNGILTDSILHATQIATKDSIIKKVDSTYIKSIKASNEALAKYNLQITDSLNSIITKLELNAVNPQLSVAPEEKGKQPVYFIKNNNRNLLNIQFVSSGGTCFHILLYCYTINKIDLKYTILKKDTLFFGDKFITDNICTTKGLYLSNDIVRYSEIIIFLTGSFSKDHQGKISIPYNYAFLFSLKENKFRGGLEIDYTDFKNLLSIK